MIRVSGQSKSRPVKAAGAEVGAQRRNQKLHAAVAKVFGALFEVQMLKKCTSLWRKAHSEVKMLKNCSPRSTFRRSDVATLHAAVAKSTFGSENVKQL